MLRDWYFGTLCSRNLRTHWKYSLPVKRFANLVAVSLCEARFTAADLEHIASRTERQLSSYCLKRTTSCSRCFCNSSGTTPPSESKKVLCSASSFCHSRRSIPRRSATDLSSISRPSRSRSCGLGNHPMDDLIAPPVCSQRSMIHLSTRMFSPKPGQRNL